MRSFKRKQDKYDRKSIRLKGFDYSTKRHYFITVCSNFRAPLFGYVRHEKSILNDAGLMVDAYWAHLPDKFPNVKLHAFIVMPNHIHGIIEIVDTGGHPGASLHTIVQWFKTMTTNAYIKGVKNHYWQPFYGKLWQRNYWEHIVRNDKNLLFIRDYIINNPKTWENDVLHPTHQ